MKPVTQLLSRFTKRSLSPQKTQRAFEQLCQATPSPRVEWPLPMISGLVDSANKELGLTLHLLDVKSLNFSDLTVTTIGFDPDCSEILFECSPKADLHVLVSGRDAHSTASLHLKTNNGWYRTSGVIADVTLGSNRSILITLRIHAIEKDENRRLYSRAIFNQANAPKVMVSAPGKAAFQCKLIDVSRQGAKIIYQGRDIRQDLATQTIVSDSLAGSPPLLSIEILFNDHFSLPLSCHLVQAKYLRSPGCHNQLRVKFIRPTTTDQCQLDEFITLVSGESRVNNTQSAA